MISCHTGDVGLLTIFGNIDRQIRMCAVATFPFTYILNLIMAPNSNGKAKSTSKKTKDRVYLTEEEKKVLQAHLDDWDSKPDKTSREAFLCSEVLPKIQQLNPDKYGPDVVSRNKEHKILWERRAEGST